MKSQADLLFELGCAELPAKSQLPLAKQLAELVEQRLKNAGFAFTDSYYFVSPRHLAVRVHDVQTAQPPKTITRKGPAIRAAYNEAGEPTPALLGFMKANQLTQTQLSQTEGYITATVTQAGSTLAAELPTLITAAVNELSMSKPMRWGVHEFSFLRQVEWLVLLLDDTVIPLSLFGLAASNLSYGHRFHHPEAITITHPRDYETLLANAKVLVDAQKREQTIKTAIIHAAAALAASPIIEEDLLKEVTGLVEWPIALTVPFSHQFLEVPQEALILAMQHHQKSFALVQDGRLIPFFITMANIDSVNPERVIQGNARVMHARLADAAFFYHTDKQTALDDFASQLAGVTFQQGLGSLQDKTLRVKSLAQLIAEQYKADALTPSLMQDIERAADLYKADLMTRMVGEFPELQGIMGYYYATVQGESKPVAEALRDYYHPRFADDTLPQTFIGQVLALAERIDSLVGIFAIGHRPTGDKDPYGLRRARLGIIRILIENKINMDLAQTIQYSLETFKAQGYLVDIDLPLKPGEMITNTGKLDENGATVTDKISVVMQTLTFIHEGSITYAQSQGLSQDECFAIRCHIKPGHIYDEHLRRQALNAFRKQPACIQLAEANKRVNNILNKSDRASSHANIVDTALFQQQEEMHLYDTLLEVEKDINEKSAQKAYTEALLSLLPLCEPIAAFFDKVMVNAEDKTLRDNRLILLHMLKKTLQHVADLSQLQIVNV